MKHKNIAVLVTALDSDGQAEILRGIEAYGKEHGCNIAVFLWFAGAFERDKHNLGEINIINLPDFNLFDGVILFSNTLHYGNIRKKIEEVLDNVVCPIVCVGCKLKNHPRIMTDSYVSMKKMLEHFVVDHRMENIHFVKGVEGNEDAEARFQAYVDVLEEHGIPVVLERITQGDFYVKGGEQAVKDILASKLPFPEAIVCANDIMAVTVCDILAERGYHIPEDVVISGYDYTIEGQNHSPRLTTVRSRFKELGEEACKVLLDMAEGKSVKQETFVSDEIVLEESCGCKQEGNRDGLRKSIVGVDISQRILLNNMILLEESIIEVNDFEDWIEALKEFISRINPPEFYCCVNENFAENVFGSGAMEQEDMSAEEKMAYSAMSEVVLAYENGTFIEKEAFASKYAYDDLFKDSEKGKLYIFSPMHYQERNFGYFVFVDSSFPIGNQLYVSWMINMGDSIETIRKQSLLKNAMKRLSEMYVRDSLTGVYNRFGMDRYFAELKKKCLISQTLLQVSFLDIDGLKKINDRYGHEEGDRIIKAAADIMQRKAGKNYVIRYGGDEFIVMGTAHSAKDAEEYWKGVQEEVEVYNKTLKKHAELSISYAYDVFEVEMTTYLEDCIRITDKKMYIEKNKKK